MNNEPVAWEGAEEWEPLAWELCADECGEESCMHMIWTMDVIPEPWGERWQKYEYEAKRMISMVRKCTHPVNCVTDSEFDNALRQRDNYHAIADNLAGAIGNYFEHDIGEHSSANNPWVNALTRIESAHPVKEQLTEIELEATFNRGYKEGAMDYASKCNPVKDLADEEIHQAIRRGFSRDGFLSDGIFLEIKEVLRKAQEK